MYHFFIFFIEYLGHQIIHSGFQALQREVEATANAPIPMNIKEVCSFLGLLNYYGKFVHNLSPWSNHLILSSRHARVKAGPVNVHRPFIWPNRN